MLLAARDLRAKGIPVRFVPGTEWTLAASLEIGPDPYGAIQACFLVEWSLATEDWILYRLSYLRVEGGHQRIDPPPMHFSSASLPTAAWFTREIRVWAEHEIQHGLFVP